jgi:hypothetical protein
VGVRYHELQTPNADAHVHAYTRQAGVLDRIRQRLLPAVGVALRFREEDLELRLTARCQGPNGWPTDAMRERIALCDGALDAEGLDEDGWQFVARMPRGLQGAFS